MSFETVLYEVGDRIATITLNRPEVLNAVSKQMQRELYEAFMNAEKDEQVWTIIVTATGRGFCPGADVSSISESGSEPMAHLEVEALSETWQPKIVKLRNDYEYAVRRIIVEGVETGVFREVDPGTATLAILGALNWTVKWFRKDGENLMCIQDAIF